MKKSEIRRIIREEVSKLVKHAENELKLAGYNIDKKIDEIESDDDYANLVAQSALELVKKFSEQEHSGFSAAQTRGLFEKLANWENLTPISDDPNEWEDVSEMAGYSFWQNKRNPKVFSDDGGKTHWKLNESVLRKHKPIVEKNIPTNEKLWKQAIAQAKKKFDVYPSAYANAWAAKWYKGKGGKWKKPADEAVYKDSGLGKWFGQKWVDVSREKDDGSHPECGRPDADKGGYPKCQPAQAAAKMSDKEKESATRRKRDAERKDKQRGKGQKPIMVKTKKEIKELLNYINKQYLEEAEYQGKKVELNKPFRTPSGPKKFSVYVKNKKGNIVKVNFGSPDMEIKRDDPERRKSFRARHKCDQKKDKTSAGYWSCKMWQKGKSVSDILDEQTLKVQVDRSSVHLPKNRKALQEFGKLWKKIMSKFHQSPTEIPKYKGIIEKVGEGKTSHIDENAGIYIYKGRKYRVEVDKPKMRKFSPTPWIISYIDERN